MSSKYHKNSKNNYKDQNWSVNRTRVITAKTLEEDFVDSAEKAIVKHLDRKEKVTTTKLRSIYQLFLDIYNKEVLRNDDKLSQESLDKLKMLHVKILYDAGRESQEKPKRNPLKDFIEDTHIISYIKDIGDSREKFMKTTQYFEALIAFHRYYAAGR